MEEAKLQHLRVGVPILAESVVFKGTKDGLKIILKADQEWPEVLAKLQEELAKNNSFFSESAVSIYTSGRILAPGEMVQLAQALADAGVSISKLEFSQVSQGKTTSSAPAAPLGAKVIKRTLRSGMQINYDGDVVVFGDLNPGAQIVASGDIYVFGTLRGVVHAGATGDLGARVAALRLAPTQLRIADLIARSPDGEEVLPEHPEVARVRDGVVVIEEFAS